MPNEDLCLKRVSTLCSKLPEVVRELHGSHATFVARKRVFAYFLNNHHNDGIVSIAAKVLPGDNALLVKSDPQRFYLPAYIGPRGWVGLRLDQGKPDWDEVSELLRGSYLLTAPKTLVALLPKP